ncbi:hypothetical protein OLS50_08890, partial [Campylobacter jejuni]|nr:hypothetical protein [Campylobacter jejuni]
EKIQQESNRLKIWMLMSKLVNTKIDLKNMEKLYLKYIEKKEILVQRLKFKNIYLVPQLALKLMI